MIRFMTQILIVVFLFTAGMSYAQRPMTASVQVRLIEAKNEEPERLDPSLSDIERKLRSFLRYKQYELIGSGGGLLSSGKSAQIRLPRNMSVQTTLLGVDNQMVVLSVRWVRQEPGRMQEELFFNTQLRIRQGETMVFGGPPSDGGVLMLAVSAR